jgi:urocanase-like protein
MIDDSRYLAEHAFAQRVLSSYLRLVPAGGASDPDLGGRLLYAAELDEDARALIVASNIAGAASLSATADPLQQKQAIRDGIVDFVVNSLDEALRILKNEIRKRTPVAVCIAARPADIERQMAERGVTPDLLRPASEPLLTDLHGLAGKAIVAWNVSSAPAHWMPKLDALALECLAPDAGSARRWLRLAPRYLGRLAQSTHLVQADRAFAARFMERVNAWGESGIAIRVRVTGDGGLDELIPVGRSSL